MRGGTGGGRVKIVRRTLADGSTKVYRYDLAAKTQQREVGARADAIHKMAGEYFASPEFRALAPRYQRDKRQRLALAAEFLGWMTFDDLTDRRARTEFYRLRDAHADRPPTADLIVGALAHLLAWAYERGMIEVNHAHKLKPIAAKVSRADRVWSDDDIAAYLAVARADLGTLMQAALYTAARQGDLCAMRADQLREGWLTYTPQKTAKKSGVVVTLPTHELAPLRELIAAAPREGALWRMQDGRPWQQNTVQRMHTAALAKAGLDDLRWHDLRGTAASRMLAAGATDAQVSAITGHSLGRGSALGAYLARTRELATGAYRAWDRAMRPAIVVDLAAARGNRVDGNRGN
jgi:integrase